MEDRRDRSAGRPGRQSLDDVDDGRRRPTTRRTSRRRRASAVDRHRDRVGGAADDLSSSPLPVSCRCSARRSPSLLGRHPRLQRAVSLTVLTAVVARRWRLLVLADRDGPARGPGRRLAGAARDRPGRRPARRADAARLLDRHPRACWSRVGQGIADGDEETPLSIFHPTYLVLAAGVDQRVPRRRPVQPLRRLRDPADRQLRAAHARRHRRRGSAPARPTSSSACSSSLIFLVAHRRWSTPRPAPSTWPSSPIRLATLPDGMRAGAAAAAAARVRHQGGGLPAVGVAARQLPDGARPGHGGVRRPAHQGRRLRDHPHPDPAVPRRPARRCCSCGRRCSP